MAALVQSGRVYLVGAGPGDPGLLTLRAVECLQAATLVIHDRLVAPRVLEFAPQAERICVGPLHGAHADRQQTVNEQMIAAARSGKTVVRLKGGDAGIFGRLGDEAAALAAARVAFEIVPGVTAASAAGAYAGIPLTHRQHASAVAFVTGHECADKPGTALDWPALAAFPGTLVFYMGLSKLASITGTLVKHGKPADTPVAVVHWASMGRQRTVTGTLASIAGDVQHAGLTAPSIALIGPVVGLRRGTAWCEARPLFGRSVLVTRPREQAGEMVRQLEVLGAWVHTLPVVEIGPPPDPAAVDRALGRLHEFDWLVFTSANGVRALLERLFVLGRDLRDLGQLRLAAIGPRTAEVLRHYHLNADVTPAEFRSEALIDALENHVRDRKVLLARADRGREILFDELQRLCQVEQIAVYSQRDAVAADPAVLELLRGGQIDCVTLTSSNIARAFVTMLDDACRAQLGNRTRIVTISPVTSATVRELGYEVAAEAQEYTADGLVAALIGLLAPPLTKGGRGGSQDGAQVGAENHAPTPPTPPS
jgi:uroporphyrinogen III methyltransferase/synthase